MKNSNRRVVKTKRTYDVFTTSKSAPRFLSISNMSDRITILLDEKMKMIIEGLATAERKSASQIIRDALYEYLKLIEATS